MSQNMAVKTPSHNLISIVILANDLQQILPELTRQQKARLARVNKTLNTLLQFELTCIHLQGLQPTHIATGNKHRLFVNGRGQVLGDGYTPKGELGSPQHADYDHEQPLEPIPKTFTNLPPIKATAAANGFSLFLDVTGGVWYCGQLEKINGRSDIVLEPQLIKNIPPMQAIAVGGYHVLLLDVNNALWGFGSHEEGQLGLGEDALNQIINPTQIINLPRIQAIAASKYASHLLDVDGNIWECGELGQFRLGGDDWQVFKKHPGLPSIQAFAVGDAHCLLLDTQGTVWVYGNNEKGQLGLGQAGDPVIVAVSIPNISPIQALAASGNHSILIDKQGGVWRCGSVIAIQGTNQKTGVYTTPSLVLGLPPVVAAFAQGSRDCLLDNSGATWETSYPLYEDQLRLSSIIQNEFRFWLNNHSLPLLSLAKLSRETKHYGLTGFKVALDRISEEKDFIVRFRAIAELAKSPWCPRHTQFNFLLGFGFTRFEATLFYTANEHLKLKGDKEEQGALVALAKLDAIYKHLMTPSRISPISSHEDKMKDFIRILQIINNPECTWEQLTKQHFETLKRHQLHPNFFVSKIEGFFNPYPSLLEALVSVEKNEENLTYLRTAVAILEASVGASILPESSLDLAIPGPAKFF